LGAGGMVDIEFLVQILQLHFRRLDLRHRSVGEILAIPDLPSLTAEERDLLHEGYRMFRAAELRLRIGFDLRTSVLPAGESLEDLALMVGFKDGTDIVKTFQSVMAKIRSVFLRVTDTLNTGNME